MPQANPRSESRRSEFSLSESARSERPRSEKSTTATATTMSQSFGEMGVTAGLRVQKEMLEVFNDISREWFERATSEAELPFKLPNKLTSAQSIPKAFSAYQEWLGEWINKRREDGRRLISDSTKIFDAGVRCFSD
jgi:hypothetical protein